MYQLLLVIVRTQQSEKHHLQALHMRKESAIETRLTFKKKTQRGLYASKINLSLRLCASTVLEQLRSHFHLTHYFVSTACLSEHKAI